MPLRSASSHAPALPLDSTAPGMWRIAACAMAALFVVVVAASPTARAADSVRLFSELAKPALLPNELSWGEARATGPTSLVLSDVVVTPPRTAYGYAMAPIRIARVTIEDIDFDGLRRGDAPSRLSARLEGITVRGAPAVLPALGPGPYRANATIEYHVRARAELRIDRFSLDLLGLASLRLSLDLGGLKASGGRLRDASLDTLTLRSGWLTYDDRSLLEKAVSAEARQQHVKESSRRRGMVHAPRRLRAKGARGGVAAPQCAARLSPGLPRSQGPAAPHLRGTPGCAGRPAARGCLAFGRGSRARRQGKLRRGEIDGSTGAGARSFRSPPPTPCAKPVPWNGATKGSCSRRGSTGRVLRSRSS